MRNPKIAVMPPTVFATNNNQQDVIWQQYRLCLAKADYQILCGKNVFRKELVSEEGTIPSDKVPLPMDPPAWKETQVFFFPNFGDL